MDGDVLVSEGFHFRTLFRGFSCGHQRENGRKLYIWTCYWINSYCICIFCCGGITGGAFNPAVYLGPMLMDTFTGGSSISHIILYLVGPLAGGALAAIIYKILNSD